MAPGKVQGFRSVAARPQRIEDVPNLHGDRHGGAPVEPAQAVEIAVQRQPRDHPQCPGIGQRRAVAVEVGQHVQLRGEVGAFAGAQCDDPFDHPLVQLRRGLAAGRMHAQHMVEQGAGRRLAGFVQPAAGKDRVVIRPPCADGRHGRVGERHHAARRPGDQSEVSIELLGIPRKFRQGAERAGMRIDQANPDDAARREPERRRRRGVQRPQRVGDRAGAFRQPRAFEQIVEPDSGQKIPLPAMVLMRQVGPFAGQGARRSGIRPRGFPGQEVGEVEHPAALGPACRSMALQPHQLGHLHLRRHRAADEVEHPVAARRARLRFGLRPVIEPGNGVPARLAARADGQGGAMVIAHHQRAGRIEADPHCLVCRDTGEPHRRAHRPGHRIPDLFGVVFGDVGADPPQLQRVLGPADQLAGRRDHSGSGAGSPHIHGDQHGRLPRLARRMEFQQPRQRPHVLDEGVGRQRLDLAPEPTRPDMAAAEIGEDSHAGGPRCLDTGRRVLDDEAVLGGNAHLARRVEEQVGRRLAVSDHAGRVDVALETGQQAGEREAQPDPLQLARRGHAERQFEPGDNLADPRGRLEFLAVERVEPVAHAAQRRLAEMRPMALVQALRDRGEAAPQIGAERHLPFDGDPLLGDQLEQHPHRQGLAVHQHAVAVENDELDRRHAAPPGLSVAGRHPLRQVMCGGGVLDRFAL